MSFLSKIKGYFSDAFGRENASLERLDNPMANLYGWSRSYYQRGQSAGAQWDHGLSVSGDSPIIDHWSSRQNIRALCSESMQGRALITRFVETCVNTGIILQSAPQASIIGITPDAAREWGKARSKEFGLWASSKDVDVRGQFNFYQKQQQYHWYQQRDNDIFVRFHYSDDPSLMSPVQLSFVDPNQVRPGADFTDTGGSLFCSNDGIERDVNGKEIAYYVQIKTPEREYKEVRIPRYTDDGLPLMTHAYRAEYANQGRGYTLLYHAIQWLEKITDLTLSHIVKAINQSNIVMGVKPSKDAPASNPFEDLARSQQDMLDQMIVDAESEGVDWRDNVRYVPIKEATMNAPGSIGVFSLQEGEELQPFENTAPAVGFGEFVNTFVTQLSAASGMSIEVLWNKFGQNYSASRATLILFYKVLAMWREDIKNDFIKVVYEAWLRAEIASGRVQAPGWEDPRIRNAWLNIDIIADPMPSINPVDEMKASAWAHVLGYDDLDSGARKYNGSSGEQNREKLREQFAELANPPWKVKDSSI